MGRYSKHQRQAKDELKGPSPMWRGLGCVLMVLILVMSYAGAFELVKANAQQGWVQVPHEIRGSLPKVSIDKQPVLYVELIVAFVLAVFGFGLFILVYSFIYRLGSPKSKEASADDWF